MSITAPAHKYVSSTMTPSSAGNAGREQGNVSLEERCMRLAEENRALKVQRNHQDQSLKELNAQFARLKRDLKVGASPRSDSGVVNDENYVPASKLSALKEKLAQVTRQRDDALRQVEELKTTLNRVRSYGAAGSGQAAARPRTTTSARTGASPRSVNVASLVNGGTMRSGNTSAGGLGGSEPVLPIAAHEAAIRDYEQRANRDGSRIHSLMAERDNLRRQLDMVGQTRDTAAHVLRSHDRADEERLAALEAECAQLRQQYASAQAQLESVTFERDRLKSEAGMRAAGPQLNASHSMRPVSASHGIAFASTSEGTLDGAAAAVPTFAESQRLIDHHGAAMHPDVRAAMANQAAQLAVLARRFEDAQAHAVSLQQECERLVGELGALQNTLAAEKRRIFQLESEKATLTVKAARTEEVERMITLKNEELVTCQQQLLEMADKMNTYVREAETHAKLEQASRLQEAQSRADVAERDMRAKERELYNARHDAQDKGRKLESALEDATHFKSLYETLAKEKGDLEMRLATAAASTPAAPGQVEDAISRLMAPTDAEMANMADTNNYEMSKLREAFAQLQRDQMESKERGDALERDAEYRSRALVTATTQRDELLSENLRLREQLTGIHTALERRERAVIQQQASHAASITLTIEHISCDGNALRRTVEAEADREAAVLAPSVFVSIDGVSVFEPAVSDVVHTLDGDVQLPFVFGGLVVAEEVASTLRKDSAQFQLHRSAGLQSRVVAATAMPVAQMLARCLQEAGDGTVVIPLRDGDGERVGDLTIRVQVSNVALALAVVRPESSMTHIGAEPATSEYSLATLSRGHNVDTDSVNAWLFSFRGVAAIRVAVLRCEELALGTHGAEPSPYVYYTATGETGTSYIQDTVVHTTGRQLTRHPVFDAESQDHAVTVGSALHSFLHGGAITFVVFDARCDDPEQNLGTAVVQLARLATSPTQTLIEELPLHPSGKLYCTVSWVRA